MCYVSFCSSGRGRRLLLLGMRFFALQKAPLAAVYTIVCDSVANAYTCGRLLIFPFSRHGSCSCCFVGPIVAVICTYCFPYVPLPDQFKGVLVLLYYNTVDGQTVARRSR